MNKWRLFNEDSSLKSSLRSWILRESQIKILNERSGKCLEILIWLIYWIYFFALDGKRIVWSDGGAQSLLCRDSRIFRNSQCSRWIFANLTVPEILWMVLTPSIFVGDSLRRVRTVPWIRWVVDFQDTVYWTFEGQSRLWILKALNCLLDSDSIPNRFDTLWCLNNFNWKNYGTLLDGLLLNTPLDTLLDTLEYQVIASCKWRPCKINNRKVSKFPKLSDTILSNLIIC